MAEYPESFGRKSNKGAAEKEEKFNPARRVSSGKGGKMEKVSNEKFKKSLADISSREIPSLTEFIPQEALLEGEFGIELDEKIVEFNEGIVTLVEDGWGGSIFTLFFEKEGCFYGWNTHKSELRYELDGSSVESPDHICSSPNILGWNPIKTGVSKEDFILQYACGFFSPVEDDGEKETTHPYHFARMVEDRPVRYQSGIIGARFQAIPTPEGWGYGYTTNSGRQFIWLPGDVVVTRGLEESKLLRPCIGGTDLIPEPDWLDRALEQSLQVERPPEGEEEFPVDNREFFKKISSPEEGILREE